ncbi:Os02g0213450 [Oryza sativa Japonica Group]|uniref:Os02g0213450 protein n=1 Tax=Oryza sativa subsp. japonica TaxID=39947 RepID=A0A0P0VGD8_ORYSJ|nr:hypothetical protein EE612_009728 [Oryza sativa]BAS77615.1 Os02g0213450 [Oryza sativa Japonica Group]
MVVLAASGWTGNRPLHMRDIRVTVESNGTFVINFKGVRGSPMVMKQEQTMLSLEAHGHANAVPELSKMVGAVQALVVQCEDLKLKYYEEMAKRKKLHNIVGRPKVQDCRELLYRSTPRIWAARMVFLCWRGHRLVLQAWPLQGVPAPSAGPSCPCSQGTTMTVAAIVVPTLCKAVNVN